MTFFTDECFAYQANALLRAFDGTSRIVALVDYYNGRKRVPDLEWIRDVSAWPEKPIVLCGDGHILTRPGERQALREAELTFVHLARGWTNLPWNLYAVKIIRVWPSILEWAKDTESPAIIEVTCREKLWRHSR